MGRGSRSKGETRVAAAKRARAKAKTKAKKTPKAKASGGSRARAKARPKAKAKSKTKAKAGSKSKAKASARKPAGKSRAKTPATTRRKAAAPRKASPKSAARAKRGQPDSAFRLAPDVRPTAMDIRLEVDPGVSDAWRGEVGINLQLGKRRSSIELHACDIRVSRARLRAGGAQLVGKVVPHPARETVEIVFDKTIEPGHARLELRFAGRLRKDLCGLYASRVGDDRYAFTQLAATHARRLMPCFDEPAMKARYRLSVVTDAKNQVLSNSRVESEDLHDDGQKTVHFEATPLLSTYLLALAVGRLESSEPVHCGDTEIRVWSVPGKQHLSGFALETAAETLRRLEEYFDLAYPYDKLDLVAVPDFEFGAMENPGAVYFRETLLLVDPETVTLAEKKRAAEVICHELAHMWYGDLVTMAWWDDLWLNEAFATWMAFAILDGWKPEWNMWQNFQHRRAAALDADALRETHPIYAPVRSAAEAVENFDLITYEKGASVLRMIERHLGADAFREGVQLYIRRHRESNAVAADLWNALGEASGQRVEGIVRPWLEQEGHPVVSVRRTERDGLAVIELQQERLLTDPPKRKSRAAAGTRWPIPMVGRIGTGKPGETRLVRHLLSKRREYIPAHGADLTFIYANADESGFFRPLHGDTELRDLIDELPCLRAVERQGLVDHQWALVRAGQASLAGLLDLAAALGDDRDPDVLAAVQQPLTSLSRRLAPDRVPEMELRLRAWVEVYYGAQMDELGWEPAPDEDDETRVRRARVLEILGVIGQASAVVKQAEERCRRYLEDRSSLPPNLSDAVVTLAAMRGDRDLYEALLTAMRSASTPQEEHRFMLSLAAFTDEESIERTLELCVSDEVAVQDVAFLLIRLFDNRAACEPTWAFIKRRWRQLERHLPPQLGGRLIAATPALLTPAYRREVADFFGKHRLPASERALRQALERFDWYAGFRERAGPELKEYLSG
jgi:puromycin-sensitive aminopeptidase